MADGTQPERFTIVVEAVPADVPAVIRLRRLLKAMLRGYGLRCVSVTTARETDSRTAPPAREVTAPAHDRHPGPEAFHCGRRSCARRERRRRVTGGHTLGATGPTCTTGRVHGRDAEKC